MIHGSRDQQRDIFFITFFNIQFKIIEPIRFYTSRFVENKQKHKRHKAFSSLLVASHPTICRLIEVLKTRRNLTEVKINQFIVRQKLLARKK